MSDPLPSLIEDQRLREQRQLTLFSSADQEDALWAAEERQGRFTAERLFKFRPEVYRAIVVGLAEGLSIIQMSRVYQVGQATIRAVREREAGPVSEEKKKAAARLRQFARAAADRLLDEVDNIPLQSLPIAMGIAIEKSLLLDGEATARVEHVSVPKHDDLNSYLDALPQADGRVVEETHCAAVPGGQKALPAPAAPDPILAGLEPGAAVPAESRAGVAPDMQSDASGAKCASGQGIGAADISIDTSEGPGIGHCAPPGRPRGSAPRARRAGRRAGGGGGSAAGPAALTTLDPSQQNFEEKVD